jgi:hypothetical protein
MIDLDRHQTFSDGFKTFAYCQEELGPTPETLTFWTGGNGEQRYFTTSKPLPSRKDVLGPGLDFKGAGGFGIAAGIHASGNAYRILEDLPIAELPPPWEEALTNYKPEPRRLVAIGERHDYLRSVAFAMACDRQSEEEILRVLRHRLTFNCEKGRRTIPDEELKALATSALAKIAKADRALELIVA